MSIGHNSLLEARAFVEEALFALRTADRAFAVEEYPRDPDERTMVRLIDAARKLEGDIDKAAAACSRPALGAGDIADVRYHEAKEDGEVR